MGDQTVKPHPARKIECCKWDGRYKLKHLSQLANRAQRPQFASMNSTTLPFSPSAKDDAPGARIGIVGAGAVGCYYGARLAQADHDVHFLLRSDYAHVAAHGLNIASHHGDFSLPSVNAAQSASEIGPVDLILVALKTTANHHLKELLQPMLKPSTIIITLQNGLGNEDSLAEFHPPEQIMGGVCFTCINRLAPGEIAHTAQGQIVLGEFAGTDMARVEQLAAVFQAAKIECKPTPSLMATRWRKLVWNTAFNGLSVAAGGVDCAQIVGSPALRQLAIELMTEFVALSTKLGFPLPAGYPETQITVTEAVGPYRPSTLIDHEMGREVEVESIWGEPLRRAEAAGIDCPRLSQLYLLLKHLTSR
jgi:2-dehydropantoate 2-reductase